MAEREIQMGNMIFPICTVLKSQKIYVPRESHIENFRLIKVWSSQEYYILYLSTGAYFHNEVYRPLLERKLSRDEGEVRRLEHLLTQRPGNFKRFVNSAT